MHTFVYALSHDCTYDRRCAYQCFHDAIIYSGKSFTSLCAIRVFRQHVVDFWLGFAVRIVFRHCREGRLTVSVMSSMLRRSSRCPPSSINTTITIVSKQSASILAIELSMNAITSRDAKCQPRIYMRVCFLPQTQTHTCA